VHRAWLGGKPRDGARRVAQRRASFLWQPINPKPESEGAGTAAAQPGAALKLSSGGASSAAVRAARAQPRRCAEIEGLLAEQQ
jgi:hypothetical protein